MRKTLILVVTVFIGYGAGCDAAPLSLPQVVEATEKCAAIISSSVVELLAQYPAGGPILRAEVARLVEEHPHLAEDFVAASRIAREAQRQAIGAGLADAALYFAKCGSCVLAEGQVRVAMKCADASARAAFVVASMPSLPDGLLGFAMPGAAINNCVGASVSRSRPGC
jgi:hypothetical protein